MGFEKNIYYNILIYLYIFYLNINVLRKTLLIAITNYIVDRLIENIT